MCHSTPTPVPGATPAYLSNLASQASRIASLSVAANLVLTGNSLADPRASETIVIDLMDAAAILAAGIAREADLLETQSQPKGA